MIGLRRDEVRCRADQLHAPLVRPLCHVEAEVRWSHRGPAGCRLTGAALTGRKVLNVVMRGAGWLRA